MNFIAAVADGDPERARLGSIALRHRRAAAVAPETRLTLGIRPEEIRIGPVANGAENRLGARVVSIQFQGALTRLALTAGDAGEITLDCDLPAATLAELGLKEGSDVPVALTADALRVFIEPAAGV
jgi:iron(III) transport system ATP-binding protein